MSPRERTIRAIERRSPDRVPAHYTVLPGARRRCARALAELRKEHPPDIVLFGYSETEEFSGHPARAAIDRWGAHWVSTTTETKGQVVIHPLADWGDLPDYDWPSALGWPEYARAEQYIEADGQQHYVLGDGDTLFQRMMYLRGVENLLIDIALGEPGLPELRDQVVAYMVGRVLRWCEIGADGVYFRDDWGSQQGLLINPETWRRTFKPAYAKLFRTVHAGGCHVFFHSDGMIVDILEDLVEIGADVIHPQMALLDVDWLAEHYGGRVSFQCDPDRQYVLPRGSPREVEAHVTGILERLAMFNGGLIGWGEIGPDVPLENARTMMRAFGAWRPTPSGSGYRDREMEANW
jgi:hypothetical protein